MNPKEIDRIIQERIEVHGREWTREITELEGVAAQTDYDNPVLRNLMGQIAQALTPALRKAIDSEFRPFMQLAGYAVYHLEESDLQRVLKAFTDLSAREIVTAAMKIAADTCVYTNREFTIEEM